MNCKEKKELDDGNCGVVRLRGKEAYVKDSSLRTETGYKADCAGELVQHSDTHSSVQEVKLEVVCRNNGCLPEEASFVCGKGFNRLTAIQLPLGSRFLCSQKRANGFDPVGIYSAL